MSHCHSAGAFVVQLRTATDFSRGRVEGRVEHIASGRTANFESADELGPALKSALASGRPSVIQVPMENAPTPTPGHWDINDIYRKGE